ncbi:MAG: hypothetical protein OXU19_15955 [bacterium]|nr:hypothetical protein [bacterium]
MALHLVHHDLSHACALTVEQEQALRRMADGDQGEHLQAAVLEILVRAHTERLWLACDCRGEGGRPPVNGPCRRMGRYFWRRLPAPHVAHAEGCVYSRVSVPHRGRDRDTRAPVEPPDDRYFTVLAIEPEELRVAEADAVADRRGQRHGSRSPKLRQRLFELMVHAGLNRYPDAETANAREWWNRIMRAARGFEIAPGRPLEDLIFPYRRTWQMDRVDDRMRAVARTWTEGHRPQGFVCGAVWDVDDHGVTGARGTRLDVVSRVTRPVIGGNPVSPPYLFMGVVGLEEGAAAWACLSGHAQPIAAMNCPVPVESNAERQAFATLKKTLGILRREFETVTFSLEKPLFETDTEHGPCLPDFVIRARPEGWEGRDSVDFMIEVMGFEDEDYRRRKEETHWAMRSLGTLCTLEAGSFATPQGLAAEGTDVTDRVRAVLRRRLTGQP